MKIAIIGPQGLPVPAVKGGAIETLIDVITKENENKKILNIDIYTVFDKDALKESHKYYKSKYIFLCKYKRYKFIRDKFISLFRKIFKVNFTYTYASQVVKYIKSNNYDKVIIEGDSSLVRPISKVIDKEKIYLHIHHDPLNTNHDTFKNELLMCNKIISVSNYVNTGVLKCVAPHEIKAEVLLNCTNIRSFDKNLYKNESSDYRKKYGIKDDDIVIMFVGRPIPQKGVKELLLAFKKLVDNYSNIKLLIVGNSGFGAEITTNYDKILMKIANSVKDNVIFTGFIHNKQLPIIHSIADIAVVPSIYDEPAGLVVIEALASGLPLIITNSGGMIEYTNDECAKIVTRNENIINNLKEAIEELIVNKNLREDMGRKAHIFAQKFSEQCYYKKFISLLND